MTTKTLTLLLIPLAIVLAVIGCQKAYYGALEKVGIHKRDVLVERVEKARDAQQAAKEQFDSALEQFTTLIGYDGGPLQETYTALKAEFDESTMRAEAVRDRIESVESVAGALFAEWEAELDQYTNAQLREKSRQTFMQTRQQYKRLINAMKRAEETIAPVLNAFRDQVLYLKHNLNAQAISSLQGELVQVESDVALLIREMETAIAEADRFIGAMTR